MFRTCVGVGWQILVYSLSHFLYLSYTRHKFESVPSPDYITKPRHQFKQPQAFFEAISAPNLTAKLRPGRGTKWNQPNPKYPAPQPSFNFFASVRVHPVPQIILNLSCPINWGLLYLSSGPCSRPSLSFFLCPPSSFLSLCLLPSLITLIFNKAETVMAMARKTSFSIFSALGPNKIIHTPFHAIIPAEAFTLAFYCGGCCNALKMSKNKSTVAEWQYTKKRHLFGRWKEKPNVRI